MRTMTPGEELLIFDELFERIDAVAACLPDGQSHEEEWTPLAEGTRLTTKRKIGGTAVNFMIFSSSTKSIENGKDLYSPTITVFRGDLQISDHIKRVNLGAKPNNQTEAKRYELLVRRLETARDLFDQYEQSTSV
jgi:hypothetical protein